MSNESRSSVPWRRAALYLVEKLLPVGVRERYMTSLNELSPADGDWLRQPLGALAGGYREQLDLAFNAILLLLQAAAVCYSFSAVPLPFGLGFIEAALLSTLILRSAFGYPGDRNGQKEPASQLSYSLNSFKDSVIAMVVLMFSQASAPLFAPGLMAQPDALLHGAAVAVPLLSTLRIVFRPKVQWKMPFQRFKMTPRKLVWTTWWLNITWIATLWGMMVADPDYLPDWVPEHDFLRTWIPLHIFIVWVRVQQNPLIRRDHIETIGENWKKKHKARRREMLFQGVRKGEPLYWTYVLTQGLLFLYLAIPLANALWPWVAGRPWEGNLVLVAVRVIVLSSLVCMWNPLKDANRVTTDALQQDIDETDWNTPMHVWWGGRLWKRVWTSVRRRFPFLNRKPRIPRVHGITGSYEMYRVGLKSIIDYLRR